MKKYFVYLLGITMFFLCSACSKNQNSTQIMNEKTDEILQQSTVLPSKAERNIHNSNSSKKTVQATVSPFQTPKVTTGPTINPAEQQKRLNASYTIVIDPGHQAHQNSEQEPIGPGASKTKPKVSSGTQGRFTNKPEYEVNLEVSLKIRDILAEKGYQVIMVRETQDVDISNAERAEIANKNQADVFVRIHCNGSEDSNDKGILTMCPTKDNPYCKRIQEESRKLSDSILSSLCDVTGAKDNGVIETDTMSGINWCKVPVTIVEMGFMTNKEEDYKLSDTEYQDKLAEGIAEGISKYLKP